tara:strand:+ start:13896 stop:14162 length:267 start_codon:yes stop_codon:yes gene_type:complete
MGVFVAGSNPAKGTKRTVKEYLTVQNKKIMKKDTKEDLANNSIFNESNPVVQKSKAMQALEKAKALEAEKLANGKKWVRIDHKTEVLK